MSKDYQRPVLDRLKEKGLLSSIAKKGLLFTALPLFILYWLYYFCIGSDIPFERAFILSLIIFPLLGIITGYLYWFIDNYKSSR